MQLPITPESAAAQDAARAASAPASAAPAAPVAKKRVLWVEDDRLISNVLAHRFVATDIDLYRAKSGEEAMELLPSIMPDGIVVDLMLPGALDGFDILRKVNDDPQFHNVPRMVLSNLSKSSDWEKARSFGATKFIVKSATSLQKIVKEIHSLVGITPR